MLRKILLASAVSLFLLGAGCINLSNPAPTVLGIYRSGDKGETWQPINSYPTSAGVKSLSGVKVYRVFMDPSDHNALYLATRGQGLFYSYDRGDSWQVVPFFAGKFIYSVAVDPTDKCTLYVTDASALYKSTDCSRSWSTIYSGQSGRIMAVAIDAANHATIHAAIEGGQVLQSQNAGGSWRVIKNFSLTIRDLYTDPQSPGRIYVAFAQRGLSRSDDSGQTWQDASGNLPSFTEALNFYRLVLDPSQRDSLYWLSKYGILHSGDAGKTWDEVKLVTSPGTVNIYTFALNPKNPKEIYYTGTVVGSQNQVSSSKLYKSIDGGVSWFNRQLPSSAVPVSLLVHPDNPTVLYVAFTTVNN